MEYFFGQTGIEFEFFATAFDLAGADVTRVDGQVTKFIGVVSNSDFNNYAPEPATSWLLLLGLSAIAAHRRRD